MYKMVRTLRKNTLKRKNTLRRRKNTLRRRSKGGFIGTRCANAYPAYNGSGALKKVINHRDKLRDYSLYHIELIVVKDFQERSRQSDPHMMILRFDDIKKINRMMVASEFMERGEINFSFILTGSKKNCRKRFQQINDFFGKFQIIYSDSESDKKKIDKILDRCIQKKYNHGKTWTEIIDAKKTQKEKKSARPLRLEDEASTEAGEISSTLAIKDKPTSPVKHSPKKRKGKLIGDGENGIRCVKYWNEKGGRKKFRMTPLKDLQQITEVHLDSGNTKFTVSFGINLYYNPTYDSEWWYNMDFYLKLSDIVKIYNIVKRNSTGKKLFRKENIVIASKFTHDSESFLRSISNFFEFFEKTNNKEVKKLFEDNFTIYEKVYGNVYEDVKVFSGTRTAGSRKLIRVKEQKGVPPHAMS